MIELITHFVWGYKQVKISMEFFSLLNKIVDIRAFTSIQICIDVGTILATMICFMVSSDFIVCKLCRIIFNMRYGQYRA